MTSGQDSKRPTGTIHTKKQLQHNRKKNTASWKVNQIRKNNSFAEIKALVSQSKNEDYNISARDII